MKTLILAVVLSLLIGCGGITEDISFELIVPDSLRLNVHALAVDLAKSVTPNSTDEDPVHWLNSAFYGAIELYAVPTIGIRFIEKDDANIVLRSIFVPYYQLDPKRRERCIQYIQNPP